MSGTLTFTEISTWKWSRPQYGHLPEKHEGRLHQHVNVEAIQLLDNSALVRMLKRTKPFELV
jgi:hypothetical protein